MARKGGLPKGTLDTLIDETRGDAAGASAVVDHDPLPVRTRSRKAKKVLPPYTSSVSKRKAPSSSGARRPVVEWETDPVSRYAASRGLPLSSGPVPAIRLAVQFAVDVREVARRERTTVFGVLSKALAGYLNTHSP